MASSPCFFCCSTKGVRPTEYDLDLCVGCAGLDRYQVLLLERLSLIGLALIDLKQDAQAPVRPSPVPLARRRVHG